MDVNVFQLQEFYARVGEIAQRRGHDVGRVIRGPVFFLTEEEMASAKLAVTGGIILIGAAGSATALEGRRY